jgi:hypothetical protein
MCLTKNADLQKDARAAHLPSRRAAGRTAKKKKKKKRE